jgi:predicted Zn finger-like uncharacterized protein
MHIVCKNVTTVYYVKEDEIAVHVARIGETTDG